MITPDLTSLNIESVLTSNFVKKPNRGFCIFDDSKSKDSIPKLLDSLAKKYGTEAEAVVVIHRPIQGLSKIQQKADKFIDLRILEIPPNIGEMKAISYGRRILRTKEQVILRGSMTSKEALESIESGASKAYSAPIINDNKASTPDATIILAAFEHFTSIPVTLQTLEKNLHNIEVVIADDGSSPDYHKMLLEKIETLSMPVFYCWQANRGFRVAASRNNGILISSGNIIIFFDGDSVPLPGTVEKHIQIHSEIEHKPRILIGNRLLATNEDFDQATKYIDFFSAIKDKVERSIPEDDVKIRVSQIERYQFHPWRVGFTCNLSITNDINKTESQLLFDENIRSRFGSEDLEYCYRYWLNNANIRIDMGLNVIHRGGKISYAANMAKASHQDIVLHAETLLYVISKYTDESFMLGFLDAMKYYVLNNKGKWQSDPNMHQSIYQGTMQYLSWQQSHIIEIKEYLNSAFNPLISRK
ncbi:MAG: glycosyltransferase [bacterium]